MENIVRQTAIGQMADTRHKILVPYKAVVTLTIGNGTHCVEGYGIEHKFKFDPELADFTFQKSLKFTHVPHYKD